MMDQNLRDKEEKIYSEIMKLRKGTDKDKYLAFDCIGILGNESTVESFESRLIIVEKLIEEHKHKNK